MERGPEAAPSSSEASCCAEAKWSHADRLGGTIVGDYERERRRGHVDAFGLSLTDFFAGFFGLKIVRRPSL